MSAKSKSYNIIILQYYSIPNSRRPWKGEDGPSEKSASADHGLVLKTTCLWGTFPDNRRKSDPPAPLPQKEELNQTEWHPPISCACELSLCELWLWTQTWTLWKAAFGLFYSVFLITMASTLDHIYFHGKQALPRGNVIAWVRWNFFSSVLTILSRVTPCCPYHRLWVQEFNSK